MSCLGIHPDFKGNVMKVKYDKLFAAVCLISVIVLFISTRQIRDLASESDPGARVFPYIGETLLAICSILVLSSKDGGTESWLNKESGRRLLIVFGCSILYAISIVWLGYLVSTFFGVIGFIYLLRGENRVKPIVMVIMIIVLTVGLYLLFTKGFSIMLPKGKLFNGGY